MDTVDSLRIILVYPGFAWLRLRGISGGMVIFRGRDECENLGFLLFACWLAAPRLIEYE